MLITASAWSLGWGTSPADVTLGPGISAHREPAPLYGIHGLVQRSHLVTWSVRGMTPPVEFGTTQVYSFANTGDRIFAAIDSGLVFTDDRGAHWSQSRWDGSQSPRAMAFDEATGFGAAVGTNGTVWTTDDRGRTWRTRRDVGDMLVDVALLGRVVAWSSVRGLVQVSADGGTSVRTIAERARSAMPVMSTYQNQLWIRVDGVSWWRVDREGSIARAERSPWDG